MFLFTHSVLLVFASDVFEVLLLGAYIFRIIMFLNEFNIMRFFFSEKSGNIPCLEVGFV